MLLVPQCQHHLRHLPLPRHPPAAAYPHDAQGVSGFQHLLAQRKDAAAHLRDSIAALAARHGERLLVSRSNQVSFAMTVGSLTGSAASGAPSSLGGGSGGAAGAASSLDAAAAASGGSAHADRNATFLGSMLFSRGISGTRVVDPAERRTIDGNLFLSYGASFDAYPTPYLTAAAAIGMTRPDVDLYIARLDKALRELARRRAPARLTAPPGAPDAAAAAPLPPRGAPGSDSRKA